MSRGPLLVCFALLALHLAHADPQRTCTLAETRTYCGYTPLNLEHEPRITHGVWDYARCIWLPDHSDVDHTTCPGSYFTRNCTEQEFQHECQGPHDTACSMACDRNRPTKCRLFSNQCEHLRDATEWETKLHCGENADTHQLIVHVSVKYTGPQVTPHTACAPVETAPHIDHILLQHRRIVSGNLPTYDATESVESYPHYHRMVDHESMRTLKGKYTASVTLLRLNHLQSHIHSFACRDNIQPLNGTCMHNYTTYGSSDPNDLAVCGPFAQQVTVGVLNGVPTPDAITCVCRTGFYAGTTYACENPYYIRACTTNEANVHARHSSICPKPYTCFLLCDDDGCFKYKEDSCLDTSYPTTCNFYDAVDICGPGYTSCQGNCFISSNISFPMQCDLSTLQCYKNGAWSPYPTQFLADDYQYTPPVPMGAQSIQTSWTSRLELRAPTSKPIDKLKQKTLVSSHVIFRDRHGIPMTSRTTLSQFSSACASLNLVVPAVCTGAYSAPCNASEIVSRCGNQALSCTKTCCPGGSCYPATTANLPLQQCNCSISVAGQSLGIGNVTGYCAQAFAGDTCNIKGLGDTLAGSCGPFTNSSLHLIDACGDQYDYCNCSSGAIGMTIGGVYIQCVGFPRACEQSEALAACGTVQGSSIVGCTTYCTADKSTCVVDHSTCAVSGVFPSNPVITRSCFAFESSLYCGEGVSACLINSQTNTFINGSCVCSPPLSVYDNQYRFTNDPNGLIYYPCVFASAHTRPCTLTERGRCGYSGVQACNARFAFADLSTYNSKTIRALSAFTNAYGTANGAGPSTFFVVPTNPNPQPFDPMLEAMTELFVASTSAVTAYLKQSYAWANVPAWQCDVGNADAGGCGGSGTASVDAQYYFYQTSYSPNLYQRTFTYNIPTVQFVDQNNNRIYAPPVLQRGTAFAGWNSMWFIECSCSGLLDPGQTTIKSEYDPTSYNGYYWVSFANVYRVQGQVFGTASPVAWDASAPYVANIACDADYYNNALDLGTIPKTDQNAKTWLGSDSGATPCHGSNRACSSIFDVDLFYATSSSQRDGFGACSTSGMTASQVTMGTEIYLPNPYTFTSQLGFIQCTQGYAQYCESSATATSTLYSDYNNIAWCNCPSSGRVGEFTPYQLNTPIGCCTGFPASSCPHVVNTYCTNYLSSPVNFVAHNINFPVFSSQPSPRTQAECDAASLYCASFTSTTQPMVLPCGGLGVAGVLSGSTLSAPTLPASVLAGNTNPTGYANYSWKYQNTLLHTMPNYDCTAAHCTTSPNVPVSPWCAVTSSITHATAPTTRQCQCFRGFDGPACNVYDWNTHGSSRSFTGLPSTYQTDVTYLTANLFQSFCNSAGQNNGHLDYTVGTCSCNQYWTTDTQGKCTVNQCLLANNLFCNGIGTCDPVAQTCTCPTGYSGPACTVIQSTLCPAVDQSTFQIWYPGNPNFAPSASQLICNGTGYCSLTGSCVCQQGALWFWSGAACTTPNMRTPCIAANGGVMQLNIAYNAAYGTTGALWCVCTNPRYTGAHCEIDTAPTYNGLVCNGLASPTCSSPGVCSCSCPTTFVGSTPTIYAGCACEYNLGPACVQPGAQVVCGYQGTSYPSITNVQSYIIPTPIVPYSDQGYQACRPYYTYSNQTNVYPNLTYACVCPNDRYGPFCQYSYCAAPNGYPNAPTNGPCNGLPCNCAGPGINCTCNCANQQIYASPGSTVGTSGAGYTYYQGTYCEINVASTCGIIASNSQIVLCSGGNSGTCIKNTTTSTYGCTCGTRYIGTYCQNTYCQAPCGPFGTCTPPPTGNAYYCVCNPASVYAHTGDPTTPCTRSTCTGLSIPSSDGTKCVCNNTAYEPPACTYLYCPFQNGIECGAPMIWDNRPAAGSCINGACNCQATAPNYVLNVTTGLCQAKCDLNHSTGASAPNLQGIITCTCASGYDPATACATSICKNNGIYTQLSTCVCVGVYTGTTCTQNLCVNGVPSTNGSSCTCTSGFTGQYCNQRICYNGGTVGSPPTGNCVCTGQFTGTNCSVPIPPILSSSFNCTNSGVSNGSACTCGFNYLGPHCEYNYCSNNGYRASSTSTCICIGRWGLDGVGNCSVNLCGLFGTPTTNGTSCNCASSFVYNSSAVSSACQLPCANGGNWNSVSSTCICLPAQTGVLCNVNVNVVAPPSTGAPTFPVTQLTTAAAPTTLNLSSDPTIAFVDFLTLPTNGYLCVAVTGTTVCATAPVTSAPAKMAYVPGVTNILFVSSLVYYTVNVTCSRSNTSFVYKFVDVNNTLSTSTSIYTLSVLSCYHTTTIIIPPTPSPSPAPVAVAASTSALAPAIIAVIVAVPVVLLVSGSLFLLYRHRAHLHKPVAAIAAAVAAPVAGRHKYQPIQLKF